MSELPNDYGDRERARAYSELQYPGTYHLAFRDLPALIARHVHGRTALDFGCGAGRSTRFLRSHGFDAIGVDSAPAMIDEARQRDPDGDYLLVPNGDLSVLAGRTFAVILAAFTFDNAGTPVHKVHLLRQLRSLLDDGGRLVTIVSTPELYRHEWLSFSTRSFAGNQGARDGDVVYTVITDIADARPVADLLCGPAAYGEIHAAAGLDSLEEVHPLGRPDEPFPWVNEHRIAPWTIRVLGAAIP